MMIKFISLANPHLLMSYLDKATQGLKDPALISRKIHQIVNHSKQGSYNQKGIDIFEQDWDNLIILDACRYDFLQNMIENYKIKGNVKAKWSRGSATPEWVTGNFTNKQLHDTIYVSASTWYLKLKNEINSEVCDFIGTIGEEYRDPPNGVISPHYVTEAALEAYQTYPQKRLLIHYVQPHKPYLGEVGTKYFPHARGISTREMVHRANIPQNKDIIKLLREAYEQTLAEVLSEVEKLVDKLDGKSVISADHGEFLGERPGITHPFIEYGHPVCFHDDILVKVPWLEVDYNVRRTIKSDQSVATSDTDMKSIDDQLEALGYKI